MESVYFLESKIEKNVRKILKDDKFMRISYIMRDSKTLNSDKEGYFLYVNANSEEIDSLNEILKNAGAEKVTGEDEKTIKKSIIVEEESAACGMGTIFG